MNIINSGKELRDFEEMIVIRGGGRWGRLLYGQAREYIQENNLFVCDSNKMICKRYPHFIFEDDLKEIFLNNQRAIIVVCVEEERIADKIYIEISNNLSLEKERILRYIPEDYEIHRERVMREGCFNGQKITYMKSNKEASRLIKDNIIKKIPFFLSRWGLIEGRVIFYNRMEGGGGTFRYRF